MRPGGSAGSLQGAGGVGGLLAVATTDTNSGTRTNYYPCYDANGNVTGYLDAGGKVAARYAYDAFGATVAQSGPLAESFTHRFSTKPFDAETGAYYYGYRHYGPERGRWFSRDPIEEDRINDWLVTSFPYVYLFVDNAPENNWDYLGQQKNEVPDPSSLKPYSDAREEYSILRRVHESHHPHCKTEGNMDVKNYENHYEGIMGSYLMHSKDTIGRLIGQNIYFFATSSSDPTQLYGMDIDGPVSIKKESRKVYFWKLELDISNVRTCGCCEKNKTCGRVKSVPQAETHRVFEYKETLK